MEKIKSWCLRSVTIAWSYIQMAGGAAIIALPLLAELVARDDVKSQVLGWFPSKEAGAVIMVFGAITFAARCRSILWPG